MTQTSHAHATTKTNIYMKVEIVQSQLLKNIKDLQRLEEVLQ